MRALLLSFLLLSSLTVFSQANDLMITEYVDWNPGSGWAIKIYNPTANPINLNAYYVQVYNGSNTSSTGSVHLGGILNAGASIIISNADNSGSSADFKACSDQVRTNLGGVNNDDCIAITLGNTNTFVDMVGLYGVAVKNQVAGVNNALKWQKLVRLNGNCTRYTSTDGTSANSWPSSATVSVTGWQVDPPTCISSGSNFSPFSIGNTLSESICHGDSFLFNGQYLKSPGTYFDTISSGSSCGQINQLLLSLSQPLMGQLSLSACRQDSLFYNNSWFRNDTNFIHQKPNAGACDSIINVEIRFTGPQADFSWQYPTTDSSQIQFQNYSTGSVDGVLWDFGDGDSTTLFDPQHQFEGEGPFKVSLWVSDSEGCGDSISYWVYIPDAELKLPIIPNIFSPNGDFMNDTYHFDISRAPVDFDVRIFDRYGLQVFHSSTVDFAWDGKYKGQACGTGTYFLQLQWEGEIYKKFLSLQR